MGVSEKSQNHPNEIHFIRLADDLIVTAKDKETAAEAKAIIQSFLEELGLTLSDSSLLIREL
jgi:RNA-directed DNA polymerase